MIAPASPPRIGIVAIGRNEGERLKRCLASIGSGFPVVYVDSASTDGSADMARETGAIVVPLDLARPFTAARARAEGFAALIAAYPALDLVQFVDGDCEFEPQWLDQASAWLDAHPEVAVVCGRRRERFPEASFYNQLADHEWNTPIGEASACGGDSLMRVSVYQQAGGFDPTMVAHEEPELCARIRATGAKIHRIDAAMTIHDAAIFHLRQYWKRAQRGGYGFAQAFWRYAGNSDNPAGGYYRRLITWGIAIPLACVAAIALLGWLGACSLLIFPVQVLRNTIRLRRYGALAWRAGYLELIAKFGEAHGAMLYAWDRLRARSRNAMVYK